MPVDSSRMKVYCLKIQTHIHHEEALRVRHSQDRIGVEDLGDIDTQNIPGFDCIVCYDDIICVLGSILNPVAMWNIYG